MYFSIGAHPGFNCCIGDAIEFEKDENLRTMRIDSSSILMDETFPVELENGRTIRLTEHIFGVNDSCDKKDSIAEKRGIEKLEKGETFLFDWTAELEG